MSSQMSQNHLSTETSLKDPAFSDPYLSAPFDADEADFRSSAIRLTPVPDDIPTQLDLSSSPCPSVHPDNSSVSVFSPEELLSSSSINDSPSADCGAPNPNLNINPAVLDNLQTSSTLSHEQHGHPTVQLTSPQPVFPSAQLLSPILTDDPSPSLDLVNPSFFSPDSDALLPPESSQKYGGLMPGLNTSPVSDGLSVNVEPESRARSPIVMVESVSRGDSPVQAFRRPSAAFLTPGGEDSDEDCNDGLDDGQSSIFRAEDGSWVRDLSTGQAGVDPASRSDDLVPSPNEMETQRLYVEKNVDIHHWTASVSAATGETGDDQFLNLRGRVDRPGNRRRAKSTGDPSLQQDLFNMKSQYDNLAIPGPGVLLQVKTDEGLSELESGIGSESPGASVFQNGEDDMDHDIPTLNEPNPELEEPLPSQFVRVLPWQGAAHDPLPKATKMQPHSSTEAMMEYQQRSKDLDRASLIANWGTREMGEAEVNSIVRGDTLEKLTIEEADRSRQQERRGSLLNLLPRASSPLKRPRSASNFSSGNADENKDQAGLQRKTSISSHRRKLSLGRRSRARNLSTGSAMAAMAGTMASIGGGGGNRLSPGTSTYPALSRGRSKSEVPLPPSAATADLVPNYGGPPVANFGFDQPLQTTEPAPIRKNLALDDDDEEDEGMVMEFPVQSRLPVPTLEGFRQQIMQLNPRLEPMLLDRLANEQVRRYKDLVEHKMSHVRQVNTKCCESRNFCLQQGGEAKILRPRTSAQESDAQTQFHVSSHNASYNDPQNLGDGVVTAAQFPPGVPLPPVQHLPAEFECSICFKVRKFQKPSDWTKHVHEDVQPFTCTFPQCNEPKSFKRKADWVRHESERHRQLEWWTCSFPDCQHTCYRKDNFVQHLVREHKMPEPKAKKASKTKGAYSTPEEIRREQQVAQLWGLVESCRHETTKNPREEPCRFCGNICSNWKKLTVHMAKHMEQIALPILGLVKERTLGPSHANSSPAAVSSTNEMPMTFGQQGDNPSGTNAITFTPTYPPPSFTTTPAQDSLFLSAEPEAMDPYEEIASQQFLHPRAEQQQHHSPLHQNSVTYPPVSFNAAPRSRTPDIDMSNNIAGMDGLFSAPDVMEPIYDSQGSMFMSPTTEYSDPMAMTTATSMSYDSGAANLQNQYV